MEMRIDIRGGGGSDSAFALLLEQWRRGPESRARLLDEVGDQIAGKAPPLTEDQASLAMGPVVTTLQRGMDGIGITRAGAFNLDFARELAREHSEWAEGVTAGELRREADLPRLRNLRALLEESRFLQPEGRLSFTTPLGSDVLDHTRVGMMLKLGCDIADGIGFPDLCAELAAAALLQGEVLDADVLAGRIHPALAECCDQGGKPLNVESVRLALAVWLDLAESVGAIPDRYLLELRAEGEGWPLPVGPVTRAYLVGMLRYRVLSCTVLRHRGD